MDNITVSEKISSLNSSINVNFGDLFKSLGKSVIGAIFLDSKEVVGNGYEALSALGLEKNINQIAWLLIYRSISRAIFSIVEESKELLCVTEVDIEALVNRIDFSLEDKTFEVNRTLFTKPKELSVLNDIIVPFGQWLDGFGLQERQIKAIVERLPSFFVLAIHEEWKSKPDEYKGIADFFESPFMNANERELSWLRYSAFLRKETENRMFDEAFSLKRIFIPLRAYYNQKINEVAGGEEADFWPPQQNKRVVVNLEEELNDWLKKADKDDAIRIISGGPGSGKSSFAKIYSANLTENQTIPVLFIPLHHFELTEDLIDAVGKFIKFDQFLMHNPLDPQTGERRIIVFFDGLDELSKQGKVASELAKQFVEEVQRKVDKFNLHETRIQVILTGRELSIQQNKEHFRRSKQILEIIPYYVNDRAKEKYHDPNHLLEKDQRKIWWKLYGLASGHNYDSLPVTLSGNNLEEITSQPLLNYLVALSYVRGKIDFTRENNLNEIYKDLLQAVHERGWANSKHPSIKDTPLKQFIRFLEVIAVSAWHGTGRTTTVKDIEAHLNNNGLKELLNKFQEGAATGVTRLLTAFYFRESGFNNVGESTFEFTHKSFGEYLTSRRIMLSLNHITKMISRRVEDPDDGWDDKTAVVYFISLCGFAKIDTYLVEFINGELQYFNKEQLINIQKTLGKLLTYCIKHDVPVDRIDPRPTFYYERIYSVNTYESLIILLSLTSECIGELYTIEWGDINTFGNILKAVTGQRTNGVNALIMSRLRYLNINSQCLDMADLYKADLSYVNFNEARLRYANLISAHLESSMLNNAVINMGNLTRANFSHSIMENCSIVKTRAQRSNFTAAILDGSEIRATDFSSSNLKYASLKHINNKIRRYGSINHYTELIFNNSNLLYTDFSGSNLRGCNFREARLRNTDFTNTDLSYSDFSTTTLENVNFINANLTSVNFDNTVMDNCNFIGSYCKLKISAGSIINEEDNDLVEGITV